MTVSPMPRRPAPKSGDVLVSRPTARADVYAISVIPSEARIVAARYQDAMEKLTNSHVGWPSMGGTRVTTPTSHGSRGIDARSSTLPSGQCRPL